MSSSEPFSYGVRLRNRMRALLSRPAHPVDVNGVRELVPWDGVTVAIADKMLTVQRRPLERVKAALRTASECKKIPFGRVMRHPRPCFARANVTTAREVDGIYVLTEQHHSELPFVHSVPVVLTADADPLCALLCLVEKGGSHQYLLVAPSLIMALTREITPPKARALFKGEVPFGAWRLEGVDMTQVLNVLAMLAIVQEESVPEKDIYNVACATIAASKVKAVEQPWKLHPEVGRALCIGWDESLRPRVNRRQAPEDTRVEAFLDEFDRLHRVYFDVEYLDRELRDPPHVWPELRRWLIGRNQGVVGTTVPTEPREDINKCLAIIGTSVAQLQGLS